MSTNISLNDNLKSEFNTTLATLDEKKVAQRLFAKDPSLWKTEPDQVKSINNRLGWLNSPENFLQRSEEIKAFADEVRTKGYKYAVLLGMGGSSLCSEVARQTFGTASGYLELLVLDNTEPAAVLDVQKKIELSKTIFIAASKSGGTIETVSFFKYFYNELQKSGSKNPGDNFIAITDAGTSLVKMAEDLKFRKVFVNPGDIGGRYSVLSDFGLVPMALMGVDISAILNEAKQMKESCDAFVPAVNNPGLSVGAIMGVCEKKGRDKLTFVLSQSIKSFGFWVEQLIAESTGKEGKGVIPVNGEQLGGPDDYTDDRIFVHLYLAIDKVEEDEKKLEALEAAGHPVVRIPVLSKNALGAEFFRWEIATAVSGVVAGINPFDEPNVAESKANTSHLLEEWSKNGSFNKTQPDFASNNIGIYTGGDAAKLGLQKATSIKGAVDAFLSSARLGDYIAMLPYFLETEGRNKTLQAWREQIRDTNKVATTLLTGPRYLHSTGQLHKGGPATGLYIILIGDDAQHLQIPEQNFGFEVLHSAQALGDFRSLSDKGRRVIRIHLGKNIDEGLKQLWESVQQTANAAK